MSSPLPSTNHPPPPTPINQDIPSADPPPALPPLQSQTDISANHPPKTKQGSSLTLPRSTSFEHEGGRRRTGLISDERLRTALNAKSQQYPSTLTDASRKPTPGPSRSVSLNLIPTSHHYNTTEEEASSDPFYADNSPPSPSSPTSRSEMFENHRDRDRSSGRGSLCGSPSPPSHRRAGNAHAYGIGLGIAGNGTLSSGGSGRYPSDPSPGSGSILRSPLARAYRSFPYNHSSSSARQLRGSFTMQAQASSSSSRTPSPQGLIKHPLAPSLSPSPYQSPSRSLTPNPNPQSHSRSSTQTHPSSLLSPPSPSHHPHPQHSTRLTNSSELDYLYDHSASLQTQLDALTSQLRATALTAKAEARRARRREEELVGLLEVGEGERERLGREVRGLRGRLERAGAGGGGGGGAGGTGRRPQMGRMLSTSTASIRRDEESGLERGHKKDRTITQTGSTSPDENMARGRGTGQIRMGVSTSGRRLGSDLDWEDEQRSGGGDGELRGEDEGISPVEVDVVGVATDITNTPAMNDPSSSFPSQSPPPPQRDHTRVGIADLGSRQQQQQFSISSPPRLSPPLSQQEQSPLAPSPPAQPPIAGLPLPRLPAPQPIRIQTQAQSQTPRPRNAITADDPAEGMSLTSNRTPPMSGSPRKVTRGKMQSRQRIRKPITPASASASASTFMHGSRMMAEGTPGSRMFTPPARSIGGHGIGTGTGMGMRYRGSPGISPYSRMAMGLSPHSHGGSGIGGSEAYDSIGSRVLGGEVGASLASELGIGNEVEVENEETEEEQGEGERLNEAGGIGAGGGELDTDGVGAGGAEGREWSSRRVGDYVLMEKQKEETSSSGGADQDPFTSQTSKKNEGQPIPRQPTSYLHRLYLRARSVLHRAWLEVQFVWVVVVFLRKVWVEGRRGIVYRALEEGEEMGERGREGAEREKSD